MFYPLDGSVVPQTSRSHWIRNQQKVADWGGYQTEEHLLRMSFYRRLCVLQAGKWQWHAKCLKYLWKYEGFSLHRKCSKTALVYLNKSKCRSLSGANMLFSLCLMFSKYSPFQQWDLAYCAQSAWEVETWWLHPLMWSSGTPREDAACMIAFKYEKKMCRET